MSTTVSYRRYMKSAQWGARRKRILRRAGGFCEQCGAKSSKLSVHHIHYENLFNETQDDLLALCEICHPAADEERRQDTAERRWDARLDGWASKKYGQYWDQYYDAGDIEDEFREWLDRREQQ